MNVSVMFALLLQHTQTLFAHKHNQILLTVEVFFGSLLVCGVSNALKYSQYVVKRRTKRTKIHISWILFTAIHTTYRSMICSPYNDATGQQHRRMMITLCCFIVQFVHRCKQEQVKVEHSRIQGSGSSVFSFFSPPSSLTLPPTTTPTQKNSATLSHTHYISRSR